MLGRQSWPAALLLSATIVTPSPTSAMEIVKFDTMADKDQSAYVGLLVEGAEKVLAAEGRTADLEKVHKLFSTTLPGDPMTIGLTQFEISLARARLIDAKNHAQNHDAPRLEVEHAMILALKANDDILLPKSFMTVGKDFKPKFPPQK
jgi:hypothetical protein